MDEPAPIACTLAPAGVPTLHRREQNRSPAQLPYQEMARENPDLVCSLNLALMRGVADGLGLDGLQPLLERREGVCCLAFRTVGA
jgi:hypothetical protein